MSNVLQLFPKVVTEALEATATDHVKEILEAERQSTNGRLHEVFAGVGPRPYSGTSNIQLFRRN